MEQTQAYTVRQLARLAGISVRTLHHYDHIGLLSPAKRTPAGYRLYRQPELLRLQQILFYKELDVPLDEIRRLLDKPGFDPVQTLQDHRRSLQRRLERLERLLSTIDKTIHTLKENEMTLTDEELYEGFSEEQRQRYEREANELYDPALVAESKKRLRKLTKAQWQAIKDEGDDVTRRLAELADRPANDPEVQAAIRRHHAWIENFYTCSAEVYRGLAQGYAEHPEFRAFYEKYRPDLADFMRDAMNTFASQVLDQAPDK